MYTSPVQQPQALSSYPGTRIYTSSSIASGSASYVDDHRLTLDHGAHPAHTHTNAVWRLVHTHDAIYAPVPPSLIRKRPAVLATRSSSSSVQSTFGPSRSLSPWYDYDEFNDHSHPQSPAPAFPADLRSSSPSNSEA